MCLILLGYEAARDFPLVFAANRDEFYERPTAEAAWWAEAPDVLAGRDLRAGGTWMGVTRGGRWAAVTNYREADAERGDARSRGGLVRDFLLGDAQPRDYVESVAARGGEYNGFNLLAGDPHGVHYFANRGGMVPRALGPGVYGLSNDVLDTRWPKVERGRRGLEELLRDGGRPDAEALFEILLDAEPAPATELPDTGVGAQWELVLSSLFIESETYGTRSSTVLLIDAAGTATFAERSFGPGRQVSSEVRHEFRVR